MRWTRNRSAGIILWIAVAGCARTHPATQPMVSEQNLANENLTVPPSEPVVILSPAPTTQTVATADRGNVATPPDLAPKPKPFVAVPPSLKLVGGRPSTLLLEHASPDSPVPLSEYANQPAYTVHAFELHSTLSQSDVERRLGKPAQIADTVDPWLVYRLVGDREIWLHFSGSENQHLDAADVVRGAEEGYVRDRVYSDQVK